VRVESAVEVGDQVVLGEVEFDLPEQLGKRDGPQFGSCEPSRWFGGRLLARLSPPRRVEVLGIDAVLVGFA